MKANNFIEENVEFEIIYKLNQNKTKIFDYRFIKENKDKCKIIYKNDEYKLEEYFEDIDNNYKNKEKISFILKINKNITNFNHMFSGCKELLLIRDKSSINIFNDTSISSDISDEINLSNEDNQNDEIFNQNEENNINKDLEDNQISSTSISPNTNKYASNNFLTKYINNEDYSLTSSKCYNFNYIFDMSYMFNECESLISLPDMSNWNTSNVIDMSYMFNGCKSLITLPDISKWNTSIVCDMCYMFNGCKSLISLPDISKWNTPKVIDNRPHKSHYAFYRVKSLTSLRDISKRNNPENTKTYINHMFDGCESLISLPDISKWNTSNTISMSYMFDQCINCLNTIS